MPAPDLTHDQISCLSAQDIERYIPRDSMHPYYITAKDHPFIRRWLKLNGMNERAVINASPTVLANAYRIGANYIRKVNEDDRGKGGFGQRSRRNSRGFPDLDLNIDFDSDTKNLLSGALDSFDSSSPSEARHIPQGTQSEPRPSSKTLELNEQAIARAAAAVIGPRLEKAKHELQISINEKVVNATKELLLTEKSREAIRDLATNAAINAAFKAIESYVEKNDQIIASLERMIPRQIEIKTPTQTRKLPAEPRHKVFPEVLESLLIGEHVYLVGEAGTGKTHMFHQLGKALDRPVTALGQTLTKYEFSGHLGPTGEYVGTLLRKAVEEGHLLAIDEIDISSAQAIAFLNSLTANRYVAFPDQVVEAHPEFRMIAAANTFGFGANQQYVGRNPLDAASLDRFTYIECHYDEDLERLLYGDTPWTSYVHRVRGAVAKLELKHIISMRAIDRGRKFLANGSDPATVCQRALWRNLAPDTISKIQNLAGRFERKIEAQAA